jgi:DNA sulfur modification protein DndB
MSYLLENIYNRSELQSFARAQRKDRVEQSISKNDVSDYVNKGWTLVREGKVRARVAREKRRSELLESRVWRLFFQMGFPLISGSGGATLTHGSKSEGTLKNQLDVVAIDESVALCIECKSAESSRRDRRFSEKLAKLAQLKRPFATAVRQAHPSEAKRKCALVMFTWGLELSDTDRDRAVENDVILFDEADLLYYEALVKHLGEAARYQFLAEAFRGKPIDGLQIKVPAVRAKMGPYTTYAFAIRPDYLLKIAYVAHRAKSRKSDIDAYQRLISKPRLKKIREYISSDRGVFPTNIVLNVERKGHIQFDRAKQEGGQNGATYGWLTLKPAYGSAWVIDGQHRLFAFSGHERASKTFLSVLAFEALPASEQAQLFVSINSEQKSVKRSLLVELDAALKWDDPDEDRRIDAVLSRLGLRLDEASDSPLHGRVLAADSTRNERRCISLTTIAGALNKPGIFINSRRKGITDYGPLWRDDAKDMLDRAQSIVVAWLAWISKEASHWWELGSAEGGGLATNNGVAICLATMRSVLGQLQSKQNLSTLETSEVLELLRPYAEACGRFLAGLSPDERLQFRRLQGGAGQTEGTRWCESGIHEAMPSFCPDGLEKWRREREANTNKQGKAILDEIEHILQDAALSALKEEFGEEDNAWWFQGVPKNVRKRVDERINESDGKAGTREQNFDFIHYKSVIQDNWELLRDRLAPDKSGKKKGTEWIDQLSRLRNIVAHPSRRQTLTFEQVNQAQDYLEWLRKANPALDT